MRLRPMPVLMLSSLTSKGSDITLAALELGAVDFITKPQQGLQEGMEKYSDMIADKIRIAASVRTFQKRTVPPVIRAPLIGSEKIIAIGASTGGTEALSHVLLPMPPTCPGIVIAQHMPPGFTRSFAQRLDKACLLSVKEAEHEERVLPGHAYIAPGGRHMELVRSGANYHIKLSDTPPVNRHRPSVDTLFESVARVAGRNAVGVILTGMGNDGAKGLLAMRNAGARTLAQSERSCVVFGMPREALALEAVTEVADLDEMSQQILNNITGQSRRI